MFNRLALLFCAVTLLFGTGFQLTPTAPPLKRPFGVSQQTQMGDEGSESPAPTPVGLSTVGGLSKEQMLEDYEYLLSCMKSGGYPFLGVARRSGMDLDAIYLGYRNQLERVDDNQQFAAILGAFCKEFKGLGHLSFIESYEWYKRYCVAYNTGDGGHFELLYNILTASKVKEAYSHLSEVERDTGATSSQTVGSRDTHRIETKIIEENKIAYVYIPTFGQSSIHGDSAILTEFYKKVANYPHLIIDLTDNGGGSDRYWRDNLLAPNLDRPISTTQYLLYNSKAVENSSFYGQTARVNRPISELPDMPNLNTEDMKFLDRFIASTMTVSPTGTDKVFGGRIWVLVGPNVYSSSETFSMLCKGTGFATLVGSSTGGDGPDPTLAMLPNSGYLVRYSVYYSLNPDGSNNEEFGTLPDIVSPAGERAVDTCLRAIHQLDRAQ